MELHRGLSSLSRRLHEPVVAIGNFDGVHVGHQELMRLAVRRARQRGGEAVVLTFDPHPARLLAPDLAPPLITKLERKLELVAQMGIDVSVVIPFTPELAACSATHFLDQVLVTGLGAKEVVVGHDFTYGRGREGNATHLREVGRRYGLDTHVVPAVTTDGRVISSSRIRALVTSGDVEGARGLLGRDHDVDGLVIQGAGRGSRIGVPTANIATSSELLPRPGVYAVSVRLPDAPELLPAVANLGSNPTFVASGTLRLEVHLLSFSGDLYGRRLRVGFHARLRDETRFPTSDALVSQIQRDIECARKVFHERPL